MRDEQQPMSVNLDLLPNQPHNDQTREPGRAGFARRVRLTVPIRWRVEPALPNS